MEDFFEKSEWIDQAESPFEALERLSEIAAYHGFDHVTCIEIVSPDAAPPDHLVLVKMPPEWVRRYVEHRYALSDPVMLKVARSSEPFTWEEAAQGAHRNGQRIMSEATEFGMSAGLTVPVHGPSGYRAQVTMAGAKIDLDPRTTRAMRFLAITAHERARSLIRSLDPVADIGLSARERDCLIWVAAGKSDWAIGRILGISEATVHWHIERAKKKFDASTRIQAIVSAMRAGTLTL